MAILIKGMDMPEFGALNIFVLPDGKVLGEVSGQAPLRLNILGTAVPVPTPHGGLIDEKRIKEYITDTIKSFEEMIMSRKDLQYYSLIAGLRTVEIMIEHAPTVIEAEEE